MYLPSKLDIINFIESQDNRKVEKTIKVNFKQKQNIVVSKLVQLSNENESNLNLSLLNFKALTLMFYVLQRYRVETIKYFLYSRNTVHFDTKTKLFLKKNSKLISRVNKKNIVDTLFHPIEVASCIYSSSNKLDKLIYYFLFRFPLSYLKYVSIPQKLYSDSVYVFDALKIISKKEKSDILLQNNQFTKLNNYLMRNGNRILMEKRLFNLFAVYNLNTISSLNKKILVDLTVHRLQIETEFIDYLNTLFYEENRYNSNLFYLFVKLISLVHPIIKVISFKEKNKNIFYIRKLDYLSKYNIILKKLVSDFQKNSLRNLEESFLSEIKKLLILTSSLYEDQINSYKYLNKYKESQNVKKKQIQVYTDPNIQSVDFSLIEKLQYLKEIQKLQY